ncbi:MAG: DUF1330 domain-containing protein [Chloroflexota bacterium]|nr:DUF1330 domain-containing protein [Chloroflexota bacterium]
MPAYVIVGDVVTDDERLHAYARLVPTTLEPFGGQLLVRGGRIDVVEGDWRVPRTVIIAFPSVDDAWKWYQSDAYQEIIELRNEAADTGYLVIAEGVD